MSVTFFSFFFDGNPCKVQCVVLIGKGLGLGAGSGWEKGKLSCCTLGFVFPGVACALLHPLPPTCSPSYLKNHGAPFQELSLSSFISFVKPFPFWFYFYTFCFVFF